MRVEPAPATDSLAILIGVSEYTATGFPSIPAARNSLDAIRRVLTDPLLCAWPGRVTTILDPASRDALSLTLAELAERTTGDLLLYYVGHGTLSPRGDLCLTVTTTRPDRPAITGVPWVDVADALRTSPARTRIAILDCCFAGQAIEALATTQTHDTVADIVHVEGVYTLTATTRNRTAHVPPVEQQTHARTSFTGELVDLITAGIPHGPETLTLGAIYPVLRHRLAAKALPLPNQRGTDLADRFVLTRNAWRPPTPPPVDARRPDPGPDTNRARSTAPRRNLADETRRVTPPPTAEGPDTRADVPGERTPSRGASLPSPVPTAGHPRPRRKVLVATAVVAVLAGGIAAAIRYAPSTDDSPSANTPQTSANTPRASGTGTAPTNDSPPAKIPQSTGTGSAGPTTSSNTTTPGPGGRTAPAGAVWCTPAMIRIQVQPTEQKTTYSPAQSIALRMVVTNQTGPTCYVDFGSKSAYVEVSSGADRYWSSADCSSRPTSDVRQLQQGGGQQVTVGFDWSWTRSDPTRCTVDGGQAKIASPTPGTAFNAKAELAGLEPSGLYMFTVADR
jgi:hypothetical protein